MKILVTGAAGFIGYHVIKKLLSSKYKYKVFGIDNLNNYYDIKLKKNRIYNLKENKSFFFKKLNISDFKELNNFTKQYKINYIIHLAAQAGVRNSIKNPKEYFDSNLLGFFNILEVSRKNKVKHLLFASTSSVYGNSKKFPLKETENTDRPESFYAASKKCNEVMAYSYSAIYKLKLTALRFFTVYGPYGRPDMALYKFVEKTLNNQSIELYNKGRHVRDFTFIDDIVDPIIKLIKKPSNKSVPFDIYNIGNEKPIKLENFIKIIEKKLGINLKIKYLSFQRGDVYKTHSSSKKLKKIINYKPKISIEEGVSKFIDWYKSYK